MALNKAKKKEIVAEIDELLSNSKMTVFARYSGTSVQAMQLLRSQGKHSGTTIKVIKNRLFKKAVEQKSLLKNIDTRALTGQLIYAFNSNDEVAPAQNLANFAKTHPQLEFVGAFTNNGQLLTAAELNHLASLPSKDSLRSQFIGVVSAPGRDLVGVLSANLHNVVGVLSAREKSLEQ